MRRASANFGALMARAQSGDARAYRELLDGARDWLTRYYRGRLPAGAWEDAVQDALIAIHNKRALYDAGRPFVPWMAAIARFLWIDRLRRAHRHAEGAHPGAEQVDHKRWPADDAFDVERWLERLAPAQAQAVRLTKLEGHSVAEAARVTGQSEALVRVNVHRALTRLVRLAREDGVS